MQLGESRAAQIAKDARIPGKGEPGKCLTYATVLHERLQAAEIPSQVIVFGYMTAGLDAEPASAPGPGVAARMRWLVTRTPAGLM